MLSINPGGQYLHILLIDLFLIAARWHYIHSDPDTIFTVLPERLLVQSPALPGNTLQIFLSSPNCSVSCSSLQEGWGWTVWLLCLYSKAWQERRGIWLWKSGACHSAGDSSASTCRAFPRGWTLLSVYLNSAHEGLPEFFFSWWFKHIANFGVAEYALLNQLTSGRSWSCPFEKASWLCGKLARSLNHLSSLLGEGIKLVMSSAAKCGHKTSKWSF